MNKKHKWKYRINVKKKILVLVVLGVFLFVGLGYAILEANLGIGGTLEVSKYDKTLYAALKREANKGYAVKYNGDHQDSMDSSKSTEDIYHFYADGDDSTKGNEIRDKFNVIFADKCWQMIRTTDTGGVKLLYNGDPETTVVDGVTHYNCDDTRDAYYIGEILSEYNLSGTKIYAKNYTVSTSGTTTTFTLVDDLDDPDDYKSINVTSSDAQSKIEDIAANYPYTCGTSATCTNANFYKVVSQSSGTTANVYKSTQRDNIGLSTYNPNTNTPADMGYKYGDVYASNTFKEETGWLIYATMAVLQPNRSFSASYKYSKTLNLTGTSTKYELDNPIFGNQIPEDTYAGYYTYQSASTVSGSQPYYLVAKKGTGYYFVRLTPTKDLAGFNIQVGTDLVDNGDNTYTVKNGVNQATVVTLTDWYNNYASYVGKYTCGDTNDTCQNPRYIAATTEADYSYIIDYNSQITLAKSINNLELSDYTTVTKEELSRNYALYEDYKYTCGDTSTICTETNLRYITGYTAKNYTYLPNHYFGKSVKYENGVYKLQDIEGVATAKNLEMLSNHHYTCLDVGVKECAQVAYVYYYIGSGSWYYIILNDPNVESIQDALDAMLKKNTTDSVIKTNVDKWYENNLLNTTYESKLDDTIYCNDRSFDTTVGKTFAESGWNDNGGNTSHLLYFKENIPTTDLNCINEEDKFSVSNNKAQLTYKIGLMSLPEMNLLNQNNIRKSISYDFYLSSPTFINSSPRIGSVNDRGRIVTSEIPGYYIEGVRPAISLVAGTKYSSGNGSMDNPYVVDMSE